MPYSDALPALLPDLRRFAAALTGAPKARADDLVLRALHQVLRDAPAGSTADPGRALRTAILHLAGNRPEAAAGAGAGALERALRDLPLMHRAALMLVSVENCTYEEAAQILGISRAVFIGRLTAARQILAQHMLGEHGHRPTGALHLRLVK